jgi:hypothetical protein
VNKIRLSNASNAFLSRTSRNSAMASTAVSKAQAPRANKTSTKTPPFEIAGFGEKSGRKSRADRDSPIT